MARRVEELECWRLADALRSRVIALCAQGRVARYDRFCDAFTDAAGNACRNISEGFTRKRSASIVQFFDYTLGSLREVQDYLKESLQRGFVDREQFSELHELAGQAFAKGVRFKQHHERELQRQAAQRRNHPRGSRSFEYSVPDHA